MADKSVVPAGRCSFAVGCCGALTLLFFLLGLLFTAMEFKQDSWYAALGMLLVAPVGFGTGIAALVEAIRAQKGESHV
jgi:hypothetical protein